VVAVADQAQTVTTAGLAAVALEAIELVLVYFLQLGKHIQLR
jgi:hypothetical protein